jgi:hypothetical protein
MKIHMVCSGVRSSSWLEFFSCLVSINLPNASNNCASFYAFNSLHSQRTILQNESINPPVKVESQWVPNLLACQGEKAFASNGERCSFKGSGRVARRGALANSIRLDWPQTESVWLQTMVATISIRELRGTSKAAEPSSTRRWIASGAEVATRTWSRQLEKENRHQGSIYDSNPVHLERCPAKSMAMSSTG